MIATVNDHTIDSFLRHDLCALILARSTCNRCISYLGDVRQLLDRGALGDTEVGVMMLDLPGVSQFRRQNPWLMNAELLPYTVLYRHGHRVDGFSASRGHFLLDHHPQSARQRPELTLIR